MADDDEDASLIGQAADRARKLTGELPQFVREAITEERRPALSDEDEETVEALIDLGLDESEAQRAVLERRVPLVLAQEAVGEEPRHTLADLAAESGVPAAVLRDIRVAYGLPLPERYGDSDVRWATLLGELMEVLPVESVVRSARARGSALAAIARTDLNLVRDELIVPMRQAGADDLTVSVALAETAEALDDIARELLVLGYEQHLEAQLGSELSAMAARSDAAEVELAIGFADVVGYTALSARVDPSGLDEVLDTFEARASDVVARDHDVSIVKYLGDAVMVVGPDVAGLARVLVEVTREVPQLDEAPLRAGLAAGEVLVREGDFFGAPVNMAARLTDLAQPWTVLADEDLGDALETDFELRRLRPVRIRGMGTRRPLVVRPGPDARGAGDEDG